MTDADGWELTRDRPVRYYPERRRLRSYERTDGTTLGQYVEDGSPVGIEAGGERPGAAFDLLADRDALDDGFPGLDAVETVVADLDPGDVEGWFVGRVTPGDDRPARGVRVRTEAPGVEATVALDPDASVERVTYAVRGVEAASSATRGLHRDEFETDRWPAAPPSLPDAVERRADGAERVERSVAFVPRHTDENPTARVVVGRVPPASERPYDVDAGSVVVQPRGRYYRGVPRDVAPTVVDPAGGTDAAVDEAVERAVDAARGRDERLIERVEATAPGNASGTEPTDAEHERE